MQSAIQMGDDDVNLYVEQMAKLKTENQSLRELLGIAQSMNSILLDKEKKEISTQTDEDEKHWKFYFFNDFLSFVNLN